MLGVACGVCRGEVLGVVVHSKFSSGAPRNRYGICMMEFSHKKTRDLQDDEGGAQERERNDSALLALGKGAARLVFDKVPFLSRDR